MSRFARTFMKLLREDEEPCRHTVRRDKVGNRVEIPFAGSYQVGKNGSGVGVPKGHTAKEDNVGQMHSIPPGKVLKIGTNGTGVVVCPGESTTEKNGQIMTKKNKLQKESSRLTMLEVLRATSIWSEGQVVRKTRKPFD